MNQQSDALQLSRTASKLWRRICEIQEDTLEGDDCTAQVMEAILDSFTIVESILEERNKQAAKSPVRTPEVEELPDQ